MICYQQSTPAVGHRGGGRVVPARLVRERGAGHRGGEAHRVLLNLDDGRGAGRGELGHRLQRRGVDHSGREERQGERAQARASMHGSHPVLNDAGAQAVVETEKPCCPSVQHKNSKTADVETLLEMVLVAQSY